VTVRDYRLPAPRPKTRGGQNKKIGALGNTFLIVLKIRWLAELNMDKINMLIKYPLLKKHENVKKYLEIGMPAPTCLRVDRQTGRIPAAPEQILINRY
jgi:hypothetical protein